MLSRSVPKDSESFSLIAVCQAAVALLNSLTNDSLDVDWFRQSAPRN